MGGCQLRNGAGRTRPMDLVMPAYSLVMRILGSCGLCGWTGVHLRTAGRGFLRLMKRLDILI